MLVFVLMLLNTYECLKSNSPHAVALVTLSQFLPEETFLSKPLALLLLGLHLVGLVYCAVVWLQASKIQTGRRIFLNKEQRLSSHYIIYTMLISNFIGICFARTLHYQFYVWYFHALPFLLWTNDNNHNNAYPVPLRLALMAAIEYAFLTFPATPTSSAVLQVAHAAILLRTSPPPILEDNQEREAKERRKIQ
jgi:alpha-1,3-mannosyltransferase